MRALVSGASGHIGAFVTRELVARGADVHVLVRPPSDLWRLSDPILGDVTPQITVHRADFVDERALAEIVAKAEPEATWHLAWEGITADARNAANQIPRNVVRTLQLLEAVRAGGCGCLIGVGSQAEYGARGPQNPGWDELLRGETEGISAYGLSKLCVGLLCQKFCELAGMRSVWLRLLATYGPQDDARHLLPGVINQLLDGKRPALTAGEQRWDYLFVTDCARAIVEAAFDERARGVFDLGSGAAPTVRELVECVRDLIDPNLPLGIGDLPYRADQVMHLQADLEPLQRVIVWAPETDLTDGLGRTVEWHRSSTNGRTVDVK